MSTKSIWKIRGPEGAEISVLDVDGAPQMALAGESIGWRDLTADVIVKGLGANNPTWAQIDSGPLFAYKFALEDECWMVYHVPHDILPSADIHFHTHWIPDGTNVNPVKWQFTYMYALGHNQAAFTPAGTVETAESAGPGVAWQHMITETTAVTIPTLTEPDGLIYVHVERIANGATDNTDNIFLLTADIHYQSTNLSTLGKAPDFYS